MRWKDVALGAGVVFSMNPAGAALAQGAPMPPAIAAPADAPYPGVIELSVDATDVTRGIFQVHERIPLAAGGPITLLYPEWLPGQHAPRGPIDKVAGLTFSAGGQTLSWRRDPVNVYAFRVDAPEGADSLDISFQYLTPVQSSQGRVVATDEMLNLQWNATLLYPAGHYGSQITFRPSVKIPEGWTLAGALDTASQDGATTTFAPVDLVTLVDSPLFAGRYARTVTLIDGPHPVRLNLFADRPEELDASREAMAAHEKLAAQALKLFGARHFDRYDFLLAITDRMSGIGLEHHRSSENGVDLGYFKDWDKSVGDHDLLPHEMTHSWNGKYRRPADLWTPGFETPMRDSLLWVYEGQTQYWGYVLAARSGLLTEEQTRDVFALTAAAYENRVGRAWRPLSDTTNDPIILARRPQAWRSWSRNEDYYSEGLLIWLDADTLIRERSGGRRSLDDFARGFFGVGDGSWTPNTYTFEDVVAALNAVEPYDWAGFLHARVDAAPTSAPLDGIARAGYRLVYTDERSGYQRDVEASSKTASFLYSLGFTVGEGASVREVQWDGPAFHLGMTVGAQILAVNGEAYDADKLRRAVTAAKSDAAARIELLVKDGDRYTTLSFDYHEGLRYPHLERVGGGRERLSQIFAPRR